MGGEERGDILQISAAQNQGDDGLGGNRIEARSGRIVKDNGRAIDQGAGDGNAAAHAAGKLGGKTIDGLFHFDEAQRFADARFDFLFVGIFFAQAEGNIFGDGHGIEKRAFLKHESDFAAEIEQFTLRAWR